MLKKILLGFLVIPTMLLANYSIKGKFDIKTTDYGNNITRTKTIDIPLTERLKIDIDVDGYEGEANFKIVDSKNVEVFAEKSPEEIEKTIMLNPNINYKLIIELKNFTGEYELELESTY